MSVDAQGGVLPAPPRRVLFVDDEPLSRQWFQQCLGNEFDIVTVASAGDAQALLREDGGAVAVLVTDYRMPGDDGMALLRRVHREHRHVVRVLATAYAGKEVAIAAVNQGRVLRILEKPLREGPTRAALREALALARSQAMERALREGRLTALRETLGFLAHELNSPLATILGLLDHLMASQQAGAAGPGALIAEHQPGEVRAALASARRRATYCQSLVATFVQSARDAYPGAGPQGFSGASLVRALMDDYPFEAEERGFTVWSVAQDFQLPGRRDLIYLALCTLVKNALQALGDVPTPALAITVDRHDGPRGESRSCVAVRDNGPGIPADLLARLTREPVATRAGKGGSGMGLLLCQRVMQSVGGEVEIESAPGQGTCVRLVFGSTRSP